MHMGLMDQLTRLFRKQATKQAARAAQDKLEAAADDVLSDAEGILEREQAKRTTMDHVRPSHEEADAIEKRLRSISLSEADTVRIVPVDDEAEERARAELAAMKAKLTEDLDR
jgi:hypothetical protein